VHLLEYGLQLIDSQIVEVSGFAKSGYWAPQTKWKNDTIEDEASATVRFRNGVCMQLTISSIDSNMKPGTLEITGTEGSYITDVHGYNSGYELRVRNGQSLTIEEGRHRPDEWHRFYQNIADHLTKGTRLIITPEWSRRPIHIIDLAVQSAKKGRALPAKYH
jgi:predicted dehydrogenase